MSGPCVYEYETTEWRNCELCSKSMFVDTAKKRLSIRLCQPCIKRVKGDLEKMKRKGLIISFNEHLENTKLIEMLSRC